MSGLEIFLFVIAMFGMILLAAWISKMIDNHDGFGPEGPPIMTLYYISKMNKEKKEKKDAGNR